MSHCKLASLVVAQSQKTHFSTSDIARSLAIGAIRTEHIALDWLRISLFFLPLTFFHSPSLFTCDSPSPPASRERDRLRPVAESLLLFGSAWLKFSIE